MSFLDFSSLKIPISGPPREGAQNGAQRTIATQPESSCQPPPNNPQSPTAAPVPKPSKPLRVPDACYDCPDSWARCHTCLHGCKIGLIIGKQYPAEHVFH